MPIPAAEKKGLQTLKDGLNVFTVREHIQTIWLLQLLCTNGSNINHTLTNLRTFYYVLETIKKVKRLFYATVLSLIMGH